MLSTDITVRSSSHWATGDQALKAYPDLELVSTDGVHFWVNKALLAAASASMRNALNDITEESLLLLEIESEALKEVLDFICGGFDQAVSLDSLLYFGLEGFPRAGQESDAAEQVVVAQDTDAEPDLFHEFAEDYIAEEDQVGFDQEDEPLVRSNRVKCPQCSHTTTPGKLKCHIEYRHTPVICPQCQVVYSSKHYLNRHVRRAHSGLELEKPLKCSQCELKFWYESQLKAHEKVHQKKDMVKRSKEPTSRHESLLCPECGLECNSQQHFKRHMRRKHSQLEKPVQCEVCDLRFWSKTHMRTHMEVHSSEKNYKCERCDKEFKQKRTLRGHLLICMGSEGGFTCKICQKTFSTSLHLKNHLHFHENADLQCSKCSARFKTEAFLRIHEREVHRILHPEKERPFSCELCGKRFVSRDTLRAHSRFAHTDDRPEKCSLCSATFKSKNALRNHVMGVHEGGYKRERNKKKFLLANAI